MAARTSLAVPPGRLLAVSRLGGAIMGGVAPSWSDPDPAGIESPHGIRALRTACVLVATPGVLEDDNFRRTVVLLLEHSSSGAVGVVLNRPSNHPVAEAFAGWDDRCAQPAVVFTGGPVQPSMIIALGRPVEGRQPEQGWQEVSGSGPDGPGRLGTVDIRVPAWELGPSFATLRVFAGYAGWSPGQLEREVRAGAWIVVDGWPEDPFTEDPDRLWAAVLRRQGGRLAMFANYPVDVVAN